MSGESLDLAGLRRMLRERVGEPAAAMPSACDAITDAVLRWWPHDHMTKLARRQDVLAAEEALAAVDVLKAKVREDMEHAWGMTANVTNAIDLLADDVVMELADYWFEETRQRNEVRACIRELKTQTP